MRRAGHTEGKDFMGPSAQDTLLLEADITTAGFVNARQHVEYRCFAGTVGADQADDFTGVDGKTQFGQGDQSTESYRYVVQF